MASLKKSKTTNKYLFNTIRNLVKYSNKTNTKVYRAVANRLSSSASHRASVNVSKLEKLKFNEKNVIIPGKVLGDGIFTKSNLNIVAFNFSNSAKEKISNAKSKYFLIDDFLKTNPTNKIKIIC